MRNQETLYRYARFGAWIRYREALELGFTKSEAIELSYFEAAAFENYAIIGPSNRVKGEVCCDIIGIEGPWGSNENLAAERAERFADDDHYCNEENPLAGQFPDLEVGWINE